MDEFSNKTENFQTFLRAKRVEISPKVAIADFRSAKQGRGLVALDEISEGEALFSIPPSALLRAESDPVLMELVHKYELDGWSALIVRMIAAQDTEEWKPYFAVLPTEFNTPMFWTPEETKELLRGSEVVDKIGRESADELYDELAKGILQEKYFTALDTSRDAFHRMGSLIMSYAFDVPAAQDQRREDRAENENENENEDEDEIDEQDDSKAMVPLADILNSHTKLQNANLTMPETADGSYEMVATKNIAKGDQIYNIYGNQPSSDMLRRYGFVEAGGTFYEAVELDLDVLVAQAQQVLNLSQETVKNRLEALADRLEELPTSFEIGLSVEDEQDAVPEIEFEPELLLTINALTLPELKKKNFKEIVAMLEDQRLYAEARKLLASAIKQRKADYGEPPKQPEPQSTQVLVEKRDMCAQVRLAELQVLDMALDWLNDEAEPPSKRQKSA